MPFPTKNNVLLCNVKEANMKKTVKLENIPPIQEERGLIFLKMTFKAICKISGTLWRLCLVIAKPTWWLIKTLFIFVVIIVAIVFKIIMDLVVGNVDSGLTSGVGDGKWEHQFYPWKNQ